MATNAKELVNKLEKQKKQNEKKNITLSLDAALYKEAKKYLKAKDLMISEVVEAFLRELVGKS